MGEERGTGGNWGREEKSELLIERGCPGGDSPIFFV